MTETAAMAKAMRREDAEQRLETLRRAKEHSERGLELVAARIAASGVERSTRRGMLARVRQP